MINKKIVLALLITCGIATPARAANWFVNPLSIITYYKAANYVLNFMQIHPAISTAIVGLGLVVSGIELVIHDTNKDIKKYSHANTTIAEQDAQITQNATAIALWTSTAKELQHKLTHAHRDQEDKKQHDAKQTQLEEKQNQERILQADLSTEQNKYAELTQQLAQEQAKLVRLQRTIKLITEDIAAQREQEKKSCSEKPAPAQQAQAHHAAMAPVVQVHAKINLQTLQQQANHLLQILKSAKHNPDQGNASVIATIENIKQKYADLTKQFDLAQQQQPTDNQLKKIQDVLKKIENELNGKQKQSRWNKFFGGKQ